MKPIKRNSALQPISHAHHQGLLTCWKIRMGIRKSIEPERIKKFCDFFYAHHLSAHFILEEKYIFPILGEKNVLIGRALAEHHALRDLFGQKNITLEELTLVEKLLEEHIRFEERTLFNEIEKTATEEELKRIATADPGGKGDNKFLESWEDEFWSK